MILKATGLRKSFINGDKALTVFSDLSLEINNNDLITIMGPSGSGKSTLLNILGTLDRATSGSLMIDNVDIFNASQNDLSRLRNSYIGFIFQYHHLLSEFTVLENVLMPQRIANVNLDTERAIELLDYIGLSDRINYFSHQLSGGERLRVAAVRALINNPKLILADEPTGNLDIENANLLISLFKKINSDFGQAFVIATHNPTVATIGNKKFFFNKDSFLSSDTV